MLNNISHQRRLWISCLIAGIFFAYSFVQMNFLNSLSIYLMKAWQIDAAQFCSLSAIYMFAAAIFFMPIGIALDHFSVRKTMLIGMAFCISGTFLFAMAKSLAIARLARFIVGINYSVGLLGCFRLVSRYFPHKLASVLGLVTTIGLMGCLVAQTPMVITSELLGWRQAMLLDGLLGVIIYTIMWIFLIEPPKIYVNENYRFNKKTLWKDFKKISFYSQNWLCAIYACSLNTPILFLGDLWGNMYLVHTEKINNQQASYIITMMFIGTMIGCTLIGWLSDLIKEKRLLMMINAILLFILVLPLLFKGPLSMFYLLMLYLIYGLLTSTQTLGYSLIAKSNQEYLIGAATGFSTTLIMIANSIFQIAFARILNFGHTQVKLNNTFIYSADDYFRALLLIPMSCVICFLTAYLLDEPEA